LAAYAPARANPTVAPAPTIAAQGAPAPAPTNTPASAPASVPTAAVPVPPPPAAAAPVAAKPAAAPAAAKPAAPAGPSTAVNIVEPPFRPPQEWKHEPAAITVKLGSRVTWTNKGAVLHTATADDGKTFDSGNLDPGQSWDWAPTQAGTFAYHCTQHAWMKGTITVTQ
jgi:plastocyanin